MTNLEPFQLEMLRHLLQVDHEDDLDDQNRRQLLIALFYKEYGLGRLANKALNIDRQRILGHDRLMRDYFASDPIYTPDMFRRRFRMRKPLFERIITAISMSNPYFTQRSDAVGVLGLSSVQKITAAIRMLAYDKSADELDEYLRIGESTTLRCLKEFCKSVIALFGPEYLRQPTIADLQRILAHNASRGFPGMVGSLDCMHWEWKNCPRSWAGQYTGRSGSSSIILEAIATYDLWVWHAFFGVPGSNNDINVLDRSSLFKDLQAGVGPSVSFTINNHTHDMGYMLTDGIYPKWRVFMQTISNPMTGKRKHFAKMQESTRKDIERCFGVLQARWAILKNPSRLWKRSTLHNVMTACIILHNMIVQNENGMLDVVPDMLNMSTAEVRQRPMRDIRLPRILENRVRMRNEQSYHLLQNNLIEHLWLHRGQQMT